MIAIYTYMLYQLSLSSLSSQSKARQGKVKKKTRQDKTITNLAAATATATHNIVTCNVGPNFALLATSGYSSTALFPEIKFEPAGCN